jgi:hypothetical protein
MPRGGDAMVKAKRTEGNTEVKPDLTPDFCLHTVVNATPFPSRFKATDDPSVVVLFDLGIIDDLTSAIYVQGVKSRIAPWHIDSTNVLSARDTTVQDAADSIQTSAF